MMKQNISTVSVPCQYWYNFTHSWIRNPDNILIIFISFCSASLHIPTSVSGPGLLAPICVVSTVEIMTNRWNIIFIAKTIISNISLNMDIISALTVTWNTSPWLQPSWCQQGLGGYEQLHQRVPATVPTVQRGRVHLLAGEQNFVSYINSQSETRSLLNLSNI